MSTGRLYQVKLNPPQAKGRLHTVRTTGTALVGSKGRLLAVSAVAAAPLPQQTFGRLHRLGLSTVQANRAPVVSVNPTALTVDSGEDFSLTGYDSDVDGTIVSRTWRLGGTVIGASPIVRPRAPVVTTDTTLTYTYSAVDDDGDTTTAAVTVTVLRAPVIIRLGDGSLAGRVYRTFTAAEVTAANAGTASSVLTTESGTSLTTQSNDPITT